MELLVTSGARLLSERESIILSHVVIFTGWGKIYTFKSLIFKKNICLLYKILCKRIIQKWGETSFLVCITMTARFSVVEKSGLFELSTVLAPEFPRGLCWNPWGGGGGSAPR